MNGHAYYHRVILIPCGWPSCHPWWKPEERYGGIPYAQPPIGKRRFAAAELWDTPWPQGHVDVSCLTDFHCYVHSGKLTIEKWMKMDPDWRCIPYWTWGFSIAMLVYRRVNVMDGFFSAVDSQQGSKNRSALYQQSSGRPTVNAIGCWSFTSTKRGLSTFERASVDFPLLPYG